MFKNTILTPIRKKEFLSKGANKEYAFFKKLDVSDPRFAKFVSKIINNVNDVCYFLKWSPNNFEAKFEYILNQMAQINPDMYSSFGYTFLFILNELLDWNITYSIWDIYMYLMYNKGILIVESTQKIDISGLVNSIINKLCNYLYNNKQTNLSFTYEYTRKTVKALSNMFMGSINVDTIQYPSMYIVYAINPITKTSICSS